MGMKETRAVQELDLIQSKSISEEETKLSHPGLLPLLESLTL